MHKFDPSILTNEDFRLMNTIIGNDRGGALREPDLIIAPDGLPYLYRWHVIHRQEKANVYFHVQVASDPERPLHDHPWDNTSVILSGGYDEMWDPQPWTAPRGIQCEGYLRRLRVGDVVHRNAGEAHRLILPEHINYTMTLFTTGPRIREWGFWFDDGWRSYKDVTEDKDGMSQFKEPSQ